MVSYKLSQEMNQCIVDGIAKGYKEYLKVREEKLGNMRISHAYAWVKGNHIDDQVAEACADLGVKYQHSKAGLSWKFLKFETEDESISFIIKNAKYFNKQAVINGKDAKGRIGEKKTYLAELVEKNHKINFDEVDTVETDDIIQLGFEDIFGLNLEDEVDLRENISEIDRFYLVTYELDPAHMISNISVFLPNPKNNKAYLVDNLTAYLNPEYAVDISSNLLEELNKQNEIRTPDAAMLGIEINDDYVEVETNDDGQMDLDYELGLNDENETRKDKHS